MKANLMLYHEWFNLTSLEQIENLIQCEQLARTKKDKFFKSLPLEEFWDCWCFNGKSILEFNYDFNAIKAENNWLERSHYTFLDRILQRNTVTENLSSTLNDLEIEFNNQNNGLMGANVINTYIEPIEKSVFDKHSWFKFHHHYFRNNPTDETYFKEGEAIYFPNLSYSDELVNGNWTNFYDEQERKKIFGSGSKEAIIRNIAEKIAIRNFYTFNPAISSNNQKIKKSFRQIFEAGEGKQKIYLSTDFESGAFEVCDYRGWHLGEYLFSGKKEKGGDSSHNIIL
jgi:hypothetical protein